MSRPTSERIHRKKLKRMARRRAQAQWKRAGRREPDGAVMDDPIFGRYTTAPVK